MRNWKVRTRREKRKRKTHTFSLGKNNTKFFDVILGAHARCLSLYTYIHTLSRESCFGANRRRRQKGKRTTLPAAARDDRETDRRALSEKKTRCNFFVEALLLLFRAVVALVGHAARGLDEHGEKQRRRRHRIASSSSGKKRL